MTGTLGPSNDEPEAVQMEMVLAKIVSEFACKYDDAPLDEIYDVIVDTFATDDPPQARLPGPRLPIEILVDRACGMDAP